MLQVLGGGVSCSLCGIRYFTTEFASCAEVPFGLFIVISTFVARGCKLDISCGRRQRVSINHQTEANTTVQIQLQLNCGRAGVTRKTPMWWCGNSASCQAWVGLVLADPRAAIKSPGNFLRNVRRVSGARSKWQEDEKAKRASRPTKILPSDTVSGCVHAAGSPQ